VPAATILSGSVDEAPGVITRTGVISRVSTFGRSLSAMKPNPSLT